MYNNSNAKVLDRLEAENTVCAKIEYKGRKEVEWIDKKALKKDVINDIVHNDYSYGNSPIIGYILIEFKLHHQVGTTRIIKK